MNSKNIVRLVLTALIAIIGAWQLQQNGSGNSSPETNGKQASSQQKRSNQHSQGKNQSSVSGDFDYYVVSLSWSPSYCQSHPNDKRQCGGKGFGFILHGVWPQKSAGGYPENCPVTSQPSNATIQKTLAFMPSEKLIQHEWTKHGTCTGLSGDEYFELADRAYAAINIPSAFQAPSTSRNLSVEQILGEFAAANADIPKDSLVLKCSGAELEEVRVCMDTKLKPTSCGKGVRTQCGRDTVQVRSVR